MKRVFVDTSGFFAHLVPEDAFHRKAESLFRRAVDESWDLVTSNAVVSETYTLLRKRARNGREMALGFLEDIEDGLCTVVRVEAGDESKAIALLRGHADKEYSFCDASSFVLMERLGLQEAVAFDRDFQIYGRFSIP